jgi:hypothetical protein
MMFDGYSYRSAGLVQQLPNGTACLQALSDDVESEWLARFMQEIDWSTRKSFYFEKQMYYRSG